jgi:hypothetical protein
VLIPVNPGLIRTGRDQRVDVSPVYLGVRLLYMTLASPSLVSRDCAFGAVRLFSCRVRKISDSLTIIFLSPSDPIPAFSCYNEVSSLELILSRP